MQQIDPQKVGEIWAQIAIEDGSDVNLTDKNIQTIREEEENCWRLSGGTVEETENSEYYRLFRKGIATALCKYTTN